MKKEYLLLLVLLASACQPVNSSELKTTKAEDLRITATVYEYKDTSLAETTAQMQTLASHVGIALDQGETLAVASDAAEGLSENVFLSNSYIFNLDKSYDGYIQKTVDSGKYYITYTDKDDVATIATLPTGKVSDVISPVEGAVLSGAEATVTWDPAGTSGVTSLYISWSGGGAAGISTKYCENTGTCTADIAGMAGTGQVELRSTMEYKVMPGFGDADISMINISRKNVSFTNTGTSKAFGEDPKAAVSSEDLAEDILHRCLRHCEEGETAIFTVAGEEHSCCIEE